MNFSAEEELNLTSLPTTHEDQPECYGATEEEMAIYSELTYWIEMVVQTAIGILGVLANLVAIPILCSKSLESIFHRMLAGLAVFDSIFIILSMMESVRRHWGLQGAYAYAFAYFLYPLQNVVLICNIYLPVALALERYRAIKHPVEYHNSNAGKNTWKCVMYYYILPVLVFAIGICIPKFFEIKISRATTTNYYTDPDANETVQENYTQAVIGFTDLRFNSDYVLWYLNVTRLITAGLVPFASLVTLNFQIYRVIVRRRSMNNRVSNQQNAALKVAATKRSHVLFVICGLFLASHILRVALGIHELVVLEQYRSSIGHDCNAVKFWTLITATVSQLLLTLNSSCNFGVYCLMSAEFREVLLAHIRRSLRRSIPELMLNNGGPNSHERMDQELGNLLTEPKGDQNRSG